MKVIKNWFKNSSVEKLENLVQSQLSNPCTTLPASKMRRMEKVVKRLWISDIWKEIYRIRSRLKCGKLHSLLVAFIFCTLIAFTGFSPLATFNSAVIAWKFKTWMIGLALEGFQFSWNARKYLGKCIFLFLFFRSPKIKKIKIFCLTSCF